MPWLTARMAPSDSFSREYSTAPADGSASAMQARNSSEHMACAQRTYFVSPVPCQKGALNSDSPWRQDARDSRIRHAGGDAPCSERSSAPPPHGLAAMNRTRIDEACGVCSCLLL